MRPIIIITLFAFIFSWQVGLAQPTWQKTFGTIYTDRAEQMIQTTDGNYVLVGTTGIGDTAEFNKAHIIKANSDGDTIWTTTYQLKGNGNGTSAYTVCETQDGGYIVGGGKFI